MIARTRVRGLTTFFTLAALAIAGLAGPLGCDSGPKKPTVTIYTSIYENVIAEMRPVLAEEFPDIEIKWYQKGSEEVAAKVNAEIAAGGVRADIIMPSDPFWYAELKDGGHLLEYTSPGAASIPEELKDSDGAFVTVRVPVMVMTVNSANLPEKAWPKTFAELTDPKWRGRITMGNPLQSGSNFTSVAALAEKYGWEYFEGLRRNEIVSAGGNSSVLNRVATGEKDVGIILLENLLKARAEDANFPTAIIYPEDGAILVPSPIAIGANAKFPEAAKRVYDFMLSEAGQRAIVGGHMYSPFEAMSGPEGARPWSEIYSTALVPWSADYLNRTRAKRDDIKENFGRIIFE